MTKWSTSARRTFRQRLKERAIVKRYHAGATLEQIAAHYRMTASGVSRLLARCNARLAPAEHAARRRVMGIPSGPRTVWPDCPASMQREYRYVRAIIGSVAARDQLQRLAKQEGKR